MSLRRAVHAGLAGAVLAAAACGREGESDGVVRVAVASNVVAAQADLAERFRSLTGREVEASTGSSGQLYAQIRNGAPFHILLSADQKRPRLLESEGLAVPGSRFTYARGRLVLYGPGLDSVRHGGSDLTEGRFQHLALANPETAPYGAAALDVLERLGVREAASRAVVQGENVAQVLQFVESGAAELGFVALAQVIDQPPARYWVVPESLHRPILQDAVLLMEGSGHDGARAYLDFLAGGEAREVLRSHGYEPPTPGGG